MYGTLLCWRRKKEGLWEGGPVGELTSVTPMPVFSADLPRRHPWGILYISTFPYILTSFFQLHTSENYQHRKTLPERPLRRQKCFQSNWTKAHRSENTFDLSTVTSFTLHLCLSYPPLSLLMQSSDNSVSSAVAGEGTDTVSIVRRSGQAPPFL